jgi:formyltetrahydrofolate-dependent phosphoribosylglycinamide formyltransferase
MKPAPRLAVLVSGSGRSLENLIKRIAARALQAQIVLVISNRADAYALTRAAQAGIPSEVIDAEKQLDPAAFSARVFAACAAAGAELVVCAGFLRLLVIPAEFEGRVINIHPSLLPAFAGKGFYGDKVHAAVLARGCQYSGCTVHYVTNEYDAGPILLQRVVEVLPVDDVHALAARVFAAECEALPEAITRHFAARG